MIARILATVVKICRPVIYFCQGPREHSRFEELAVHVLLAISCSNKGTKTTMQTRHDLPSARTLLQLEQDGFITGSRVQQATVSSTFFMPLPDSFYIVASIRHTIPSCACNWELRPRIVRNMMPIQNEVSSTEHFASSEVNVH